MNPKQIRKRRQGNPSHFKYRIRLLSVVLAALCLSGCGVISSDPTKDVAEQSLLKAGTQSRTPEIPYSDQIDTIIQNKEIWCFTMPADAEEEYGWNESNYYYQAADMDQDGYLEIISSSTTGNGCVFYNEYYEVSRDGKSLVRLAGDEGEDRPTADLWSVGECAEGYYDGKTGTYHYPQPDHTHSSGWDTSDAQLDTVLSDGAVTVNTISYVESAPYGESGEKDFGCRVTYYAGEKAEKLGEIKQPYDEDTQDVIHDEKQETEYADQLDELYRQYYEGMQKFTVTSHMFSNIEEEGGEKADQEIVVVSDETLRKRLKESWDSFGIHVLQDKTSDNPFFPKSAAGESEVRFKLDLLDTGKAAMQIQEEERGNQGILYHLSVCDPREISNSEFGIAEGKTEEKEFKKYKKDLNKRFEDFYFYLWVTDTQIYYIPDFYSDTGEVSADDIDNGKFLDSEILGDEHVKMRLVFYNELPSYARLICQEEESKDALQEEEEGDHQWIEKQGEDICFYHAYTFRGEGYESADILQFVWKRDVGLIGVSTAAHPAGGFSYLFWQEAYLEDDHISFTIHSDAVIEEPEETPISYVAENGEYALALPAAEYFGQELQEFIYWEYATMIEKDVHGSMSVLTNLEDNHCLERNLKLHLYYDECDVSEMDEGNANFYHIIVTFPEETQMSYYAFQYTANGLSSDYDYGNDGGWFEEEVEDEISSQALEEISSFREQYTFFGEISLHLSRKEAERAENTITSRFEKGEKEQILAAITKAIQKEYAGKKNKNLFIYIRDFLPGDTQLSGEVVDLNMTDPYDIPLYWIRSHIYYKDEKMEEFDGIYWDVRYSTAYSGASQPDYHPTVKQLKKWAKEEKEAVDVEKCVLAYQIQDGAIHSITESRRNS